MPLLPALLTLAAVASGPVEDPAPEPSRPELSLHAWVRGGYAVAAAEEVEHGPVLTLARLQARSTYKDRYRMFFQLGADRGNVQLLDARATVDLGKHVELTAGRFKEPVSHEVLIPAPEMLLPSRAQLVGISPRRAIGMQATWSHPGEHVTQTVRAGVFDPLKLGHAGFGGAQVVLQADLHSHDGWFAHGAGAAWLHPDDATDKLGEDAPAEDAHADIALGRITEHWTIDTEVLAAHTTEGDEWLVGAGAVLAHRVDVHHGDVVLEPVLAWDGLASVDEPMAHRLTAGINVHEDGWRLVQSLAWEVEVGEETPVHLVTAQIQAGL